MTRRTRLAALGLAALVPLMAATAACGEDDGAEVRELDGSDGSSGSGSASASASASGSGSASASEAASGSGVAEVACVPVGDPATADTTVPVELDEWKITLGSTELPAGTIAFEATNLGEDAHEMLIVRAESLDDLPTDADGHIDESAIAEEDFVGEIEPFPSGESCTGVFDLEPGTYAVVCAIVEEEPDGTIEDHFMLGMAELVTVS